MYFSCNALARKIEKIAVESWKPVGLSPSHAYLLLMAIQEPGVQPGFLADHLQLQPSTITRLIEKLEEKKLVVRINEGKITNVYATPKGKEMHEKLKECLQNFFNAYTGVLGKEASTQMVSSMNKLADKLC